MLSEKQRAGIRNRMKQVRGDRSQRQFALDLKTFQQNVHRYEKEDGPVPGADFLVQLALTEGVSIDWVLLGEGEMQRKLAKPKVANKKPRKPAKLVSAA